MSDPTYIDATLRENLILASALFHAKPPTDRIYANSATVLRHAMAADELWTIEVAAAASGAFTGDEDSLKEFPIFTTWYDTLIEMTREKAGRPALLNPGGNLDLPAGAYFTACWLTPAGRAAAERLLEKHPEWKQLVATESSVPVQQDQADRAGGPVWPPPLA